jgi:hypothetical protein
VKKAQNILRKLVYYLVVNRGLSGRIASIRLQHSDEQDARNEKDARAFAATKPDRPKSIFCAHAILLHEIGHLMTMREGGGEPAADAWVVALIPEAGLRYADASYSGRLARNIETVQASFLLKIGV